MGAPSSRRAGRALLVALLVFVVCKYLGTASVWKLTHWLFAYDLGFVKRGLPGTLLQAVSGPVVRAETIVVVSLAFAAAFVVALAGLAAPLFRGTASTRAVGIASVALLTPGVGFLVCDLARFDVVNLALSIGAILLALRLGRLPPALLVAVSLGVLLVHEAALLLCLPLLLVAHLELDGRLETLTDRRTWPRLVLLAAPALALFLWLVAFGATDRSLPELVSSLAARADFAPSPRSAYVLLRPLQSNVAQVLGEDAVPAADPEMARVLALGSPETLAFWLILGVALVQQAYAHAAFAGLEPARRRAVRLALHGGFALPLVLMLVGVDWSRWVAGGSAQCAVLMLLFARRLPVGGEPRASRGFVLGSLFTLVLLAGSGLPMQGARRGIVMSPQAGVMSWLTDHEASEAWYRAFARGLSPPRAAAPRRPGAGGPATGGTPPRRR